MGRVAKNRNLPKYCQRRSYGVIYTPYLGKGVKGTPVNLGPPSMTDEDAWDAYYEHLGGRPIKRGVDTGQTETMVKAHRAVRTAIRNGTLTAQPCEECGAAKAHAHHDDYLQPLQVRWLCNDHHRKWHAKHGPGANAGDKPYKASQRRICLSDCTKCRHRVTVPLKGKWCEARQREPQGLCSDFRRSARSAIQVR